MAMHYFEKICLILENSIEIRARNKVQIIRELLMYFITIFQKQNRRNQRTHS